MTPTSYYQTLKPPPFEGCERTAKQIGQKFIVIERQRDSRNRAVFVRLERTYTRDEVVANFPDVVID